jgi:PKD repeat protein
VTALKKWFLGTDQVWRAFGEPYGIPSGAPSVITPTFTARVQGSLLTVDATGTTSTGSTIVAYGWDYGDGTTGTGLTATHTYLASGTYTVALTVLGDRNTTATAAHTVTVSAPVASFTATPSGLVVAFDGTGSTDVGSTLTSYAWTFGDGGAGAGATASHTYATAGNYTVTLTVRDAAGSTATSSRAVSVAQPTSSPTAAFTTAVTGYAVTFDASASGSTNGATITRYAWLYGDGASSTGRTTSHTYVAGTWTATLTVTDSQNRTATTTHTVTVTAPPNQPPTAAFTATPNGLTVTFASTSTDGDGSITNTAWTFGDGGTGTGATVAHTYATAGTYTARVTVTDNLGATATTTRTVTVTTPPVPDTDYIIGSPVTSTALHPSSTAAVLQAIVHVPATGGYYTAQVHPEANGDESTRLSRLSPTGALLDQMMLTRAGHGTTLQIEYTGGVAYVWLTWELDAAGTTINNIVRFPYKAGTYDYTTVPGKTVKMTGPTYRHVGFDTAAGYGWVRTTGTQDTVRRYPIANVLSGTLGTALNTITLVPGLFRQGWTSYYDSFFLLRGAPSDDGSVPQQLIETGWKSGTTVRTVDVSKVTGSTAIREPEGLCVYFPGTQPRLQFGITLGPHGGPHTYPTFDIPLALQGQQQRAALVPGTYTPDASTTGLLPGWTEAKLTSTITGTNGNLQLVAGQVIENALIKCRVLRPTTGTATLRNCAITAELYPYQSKATASALVDCTATGTGTLLIEDCLLEARGLALSYFVDGIHGFNYTARRVRIRHTVDAFGSVNTHNSNGPINSVIEGCMGGELAYYTPDPTHADGHTHNDGLQIFGNSGLIVRGNRIEAIIDTTVAQGAQAPNQLGGGKAIATGQAIAYTPTSGVITGTNVWGNYLDGGQQTITAIPTPKGGSAIGNIHDNRFGRNQIVKSLNTGGSPLDSGSKKRPILIDPGDTATGIAPLASGTSKVDTNGNVYADTGQPITDYVSTGA